MVVSAENYGRVQKIDRKVAEGMERGTAGEIAGRTTKRMDTGSGTESRRVVDGGKDGVKDSRRKVRDKEGKTGVGRSGKWSAEDGNALSKQRNGEKCRDGSLPRERKGADGLSVPKKQDERGPSARYRREDSRRSSSYGGRRTRRSTSICSVLNLCGGCRLLDMEYAKQLDPERKQAEEPLKGLCPAKLVIGMKDPFYYYNKARAVFDRDKEGNIISEIYEENAHHVVPAEKRLIESQKADEIIGTIRGMFKPFKVRTYDEDTGFRFLRHVLIRKGFSAGEIMVVPVMASPVSPPKSNPVKALQEKHPEITIIVQNINGRGASMVPDDKEYVLYGRGYIMDGLCGYRFRISSRPFHRVNSVQMEILYEEVLSLSDLIRRELAVDVYCSVGTIGTVVGKAAGKVIGVELNQGAVRDAVNNAKMNGIDNIRSHCNDADRFLVNMAGQDENIDVVIIDPPRSGSMEEFMDTVGKPGAGKVVRALCNPETLAEDVRYMKKLRYRAVEAWSVGMFPETDHVEIVVLI